MDGATLGKKSRVHPENTDMSSGGEAPGRRCGKALIRVYMDPRDSPGGGAVIPVIMDGATMGKKSRVHPENTDMSSGGEAPGRRCGKAPCAGVVVGVLLTLGLTAALIALIRVYMDPRDSPDGGAVKNVLFSYGDTKYSQGALYTGGWPGACHRYRFADVGEGVGSWSSINPPITTLTVPYDDVYFITNTAAPRAGSLLLNRIRLNDIYVGIESHPITTSTRSILTQFSRGTKVYLEVFSGYVVNDAFSGFSLRGAMDPAVGFSYTSAAGSSTPGTVHFPTEHYNSGSFDQASSTFTAPEGGLYFFQGSYRVLTSTTSHAAIGNDTADLVSMSQASSAHDGVSFVSGSTIARLNSGELVRMRLIDGTVGSSNEFNELSFTGFLISPIGTDRVAFSLSRDSSENGTISNTPVHFDTIHMMERMRLRDNTTVVTELTGTYLIYMSVSGRPLHRGIQLQLGINGDYANSYYMGVIIGVGGVGDYTSCASTLIRTFGAGTELSVYYKTIEGAAIDGDSLRISFMGFLVSSDTS